MVIKQAGAKGAAAALVVLVLLVLPIALGGDARILNILSVFLMWAVVASAWDLSMGYAKVWSFGHIALFAIGGYAGAMTVMHLSVPPLLAVPLGGIAAAVVGVLIGLPALRLQGVYIAMVSFSIHLVLPTFITWKSEYTGGDPGLFGFDSPSIGRFIYSSSQPVFSFYVTLVVSLVMLGLVYYIIRSPIGLAFMGLRDSEKYAKSLGIDDYKYRLLVFGISAFMAGFMGALYTAFYGTISPRILEISTFLMVLIMLMLGGVGRFPGAVVGAFFITVLAELLRPVHYLRFVVLGAIVIAVIVAMPQGLVGVYDLVVGHGRRIIGWSARSERRSPPDLVGPAAEGGLDETVKG